MNAIDLLLAFRELPYETIVPLYDLDFLRKEVSQFSAWYLPLTGVHCTETMKKEFLDTWNAPLKLLCADGKQGVFVHKDFHGGNLMWLPQRSGLGRIGIIDFQNAKFGSSAYDLVSLLYDSRGEMTGELRSDLFQYFMAAARPDYDAFIELAHIVIVQRHVKILGNFARVYLAESRPDYLQYLPTVWKLIGNSLYEPIFTDVKYWLDHYGIIEMANQKFGLALERDARRLFPLQSLTGKSTC